MARVYAPPSQDFLQKTLSAELLDGVTASASLNNVTGIQNLPGVMIVDRVDANGTETPNKVEVIAFTGTSGSTVVTLTRGLAGTTDKDHAVSAVVEFAPDVIWAQSIYDALSTVVAPATGLLDTTKVVDLTSTQTITGAKTLDEIIVRDSANAQVAKTIAGYFQKPTFVSIQVAGGTTDLSTGDGKYYFTIPPELNGMVINRVHARVVTAGTTGTTDIQIANVTDTVDVLSTKLTIDTGETGSDTAATPAVINASNDDVATNDLFRIDIDAVSTTAPKGLIINIGFGF